MRRLGRILVANRGEIARRVLRTLREMGIASVAVYSDADAGAPHVGEADEAVRIGPAPSRESYLDIGRILHAARAVGADAIHPGYGFLAENASFAERCEQAGLVFIGPPVDAIRKMGSKIEAKAIMGKAGVPIIPGFAAEGLSDGDIASEIGKIGLPVLLKASAGGGGKGMRIVRDLAALGEALAGARREAEAASAPGARPRRPSATPRCSSSATSTHPATSRCRSSATRRAVFFTASSASARSRGVTRR
jgi:acetyl-CoA/propionyl-CoA carboxylase biotin carboxyl carrier protein